MDDKLFFLRSINKKYGLFTPLPLQIKHEAKRQFIRKKKLLILKKRNKNQIPRILPSKNKLISRINNSLPITHQDNIFNNKDKDQDNFSKKKITYRKITYQFNYNYFMNNKKFISKNNKKFISENNIRNMTTRTSNKVIKNYIKIFKNIINNLSIQKENCKKTIKVVRKIIHGKTIRRKIIRKKIFSKKTLYINFGKMISLRRKKLAINKKLRILSPQETSPEASLNLLKSLYKRFYRLNLKLILKNLKKKSKIYKGSII